MNDETLGKDECGQEYTREEIEKKIERGLAQLERGEFLNGEEFFEQLKRRQVKRSST